MSNFILYFGILLAQAEGAAGEPADKGNPSLLESIVGNPLSLFAILGILFYVMILKPQNRKQKQMRQMLESIKINDRIVTIGGIQGTVVSLSGQDVSIRIDDNTNTKIRLGRPYIARVITEEEKSDTKSS